jgi:hypothetical protein
MPVRKKTGPSCAGKDRASTSFEPPALSKELELFFIAMVAFVSTNLRALTRESCQACRNRIA